MTLFEIHVAVPRGTLLIGGYSAVPKGLHALQARDHQGQPVIPATALRGALRETLESLLRGAGHVACQGGTGRVPGSEDGAVSCVLDQGGPCRACRLFGRQRAAIEPGETAFSAMILGAAGVATASRRASWQHRHGVALSRTRRSAEEDHLFTRAVPDLAGVKLVARGQLLDSNCRSDLLAAARATTHIGSGRGKGLARVDLEVVFPSEAPGTHPGELGRDEAEPQEVGVRVRLLAPAAIHGLAVAENVRSARADVPGSMLRGAIGFTLARSLEDPDHHEAFQALVSEAGAAFGFLFPCTTSDVASSGLCAPWPITAKACKKDGEHRTVDTLVERVVEALADAQPGPSPIDRLPSSSSCPDCAAPLRAAKGTRRAMRAPAKRLVTRVSLERPTSSASDGKLFAQELTEPGAVFEGTIRRIPSGGIELLERAASERLFLGRGTSAGLGECEISLYCPVQRDDLVTRGEAFGKLLRGRLERFKIATDKVERLVPITLLSPLFFVEGGDGSEAIASRLPEFQGWLLRLRRFGLDGGWDQRTGQLHVAQVVASGAVFVAELQKPWRTCCEELVALERQGVGERTHQGFGHVVCFDPFILEGTRDV